MSEIVFCELALWFNWTGRLGPYLTATPKRGFGNLNIAKAVVGKYHNELWTPSIWSFFTWLVLEPRLFSLPCYCLLFRHSSDCKQCFSIAHCIVGVTSELLAGSWCYVCSTYPGNARLIPPSDCPAWLTEACVTVVAIGLSVDYARPRQTAKRQITWAFSEFLLAAGSTRFASTCELVLVYMTGVCSAYITRREPARSEPVCI